MRDTMKIFFLNATKDEKLTIRIRHLNCGFFLGRKMSNLDCHPYFKDLNSPKITDFHIDIRLIQLTK